MPCKTHAAKNCLADPEGDSIGLVTMNLNDKQYSRQDCERICTSQRLCNSFSYQPVSKECYLKTKVISELQSRKEHHANMYTVYKTCGKGNIG